MGHHEMCAKAISRERDPSFPIGPPTPLLHPPVPIASDMVSRHDCINFDVCPVFTYPTLLLTPMFRISDWVLFLVLDVGDAAFSQLSVGVQVINGLLQASTIRTAGFSVVSIAALSPAVKLVIFEI